MKKSSILLGLLCVINLWSGNSGLSNFHTNKGELYIRNESLIPVVVFVYVHHINGPVLPEDYVYLPPKSKEGWVIPSNNTYVQVGVDREPYTYDARIPFCKLSRYLHEKESGNSYFNGGELVIEKGRSEKGKEPFQTCNRIDGCTVFYSDTYMYITYEPNKTDRKFQKCS